MGLKTYNLDEDLTKEFKIYCAQNDKHMSTVLNNLISHEMTKHLEGSIPNLLEDSPEIIASYIRQLPTDDIKKVEWLGRIIEIYASAYVQVDQKERPKTIFQSPAHAERYAKSGGF